jgi:hypothetical protein
LPTISLGKTRSSRMASWTEVSIRLQIAQLISALQVAHFTLMNIPKSNTRKSEKYSPLTLASGGYVTCGRYCECIKCIDKSYLRYVSPSWSFLFLISRLSCRFGQDSSLKIQKIENNKVEKLQQGYKQGKVTFWLLCEF